MVRGAGPGLDADHRGGGHRSGRELSARYRRAPRSGRGHRPVGLPVRRVPCVRHRRRGYRNGPAGREQWPAEVPRSLGPARQVRDRDSETVGAAKRATTWRPPSSSRKPPARKARTCTVVALTRSRPASFVCRPPSPQDPQQPRPPRETACGVRLLAGGLGHRRSPVPSSSGDVTGAARRS